MEKILERIDRRINGTAQKPDEAAAEAPKKSASLPSWTLPGFGPMTRISTSFGEVHAQALRVGDLVRTQSGAQAPITFIDRLKLDADFMERSPHAYPILIRSGALGGGLPKADVIVSSGQLLGIGRHSFDVRFVRAGELLGRPGIVRRPDDMVTYTIFHCDQPVCVRTEGIWAKLEA